MVLNKSLRGQKVSLKKGFIERRAGQSEDRVLGRGGQTQARGSTEETKVAAILG